MKKIVLGILTISIIASLLSGCGEKPGELEGKWAYIHDTEKVELSIDSRGKAIFEGKQYKVNVDDTFISFKSEGKEEKMRYLLDKDGMLLYKNTVYTLDAGQTKDGLIGKWSAGNGWAFEFTEDGTFNEDGYFPGYYIVDDNSQTIKLIYNDHFEDTVIYYELEDEKLTLHYPWRMVKIN